MGERSVLEILCSASAYFVITTLKNLARDGRTVIASIHQPSSEVFDLFENLFLLSSGQTIFFGAAASAHEVRHHNALKCWSLSRLSYDDCDRRISWKVKCLNCSTSQLLDFLARTFETLPIIFFVQWTQTSTGLRRKSRDPSNTGWDTGIPLTF